MDEGYTFIERFNKFEERCELFNWHIEGMPVWELIRTKIYLMINPAYSNTIRTSDVEPGKVIKGLYYFFKNLVYKNPKNLDRKVDNIFFNHPRRKKNLKTGLYEDIYTDYILDLLDDNRYIVLESFFQLKHFQPVRTKNLYYLDALDYSSRFIKFFKKLELSQEDLLRINDLKRAIELEFGVEVKNLNKEITNELLISLYLYKEIETLFKRLKPKRIFLVVSYSGINMIASLVANNLGIETCEFQHGTVGSEHYNYNYNKNAKVNFFPKKFFSWGEYWTHSTRFPKNTIVSELGFPYLNFHLNNSNEMEKKNQILVISQLDKKLAEFALELAKITNLKILFKPHPTEYSYIEKEYGFLFGQEKIEVITDYNFDLYQGFRESKFILGVFSTALIEALLFNCIVIIPKINGWTYFKDIKSANFLFVESPEEANLVIQDSKFNFSEEGKGYFFKTVSTETICDKLFF